VIKSDLNLSPPDLLPQLARFWARSAQRINAIQESCRPGGPSPVFTVQGR
jgi:hypothetical protein